MSKIKEIKTLLFIGPSPMAVGGVAVHIRRLSFLLDQLFQIRYIDEGKARNADIFNIHSYNIFKYFNLVEGSDIVHIHSGSYILRILHIIVSKFILRKKTVITIHHDVERERLLSLSKYFIKKSDTLIVVNKNTYDVFDGVVKNLVLLPAFIPPIIENEPELPSEVIRWIDNCRKNKDAVIMISNAWNLVTHDGCDLYGLDLCLNAMKLLRDINEINYYLIFVVVSNTSNQDLMCKYKQFVENNNLQDNVLIWESELSFIRLIGESDIVLRTTNTDGDALTIREALFYEKTVIASDVVERPKNTLLFKNRDVNSLVDMILNTSVLSDKSCEFHDFDFYREKYLNIYNN